jgi:hypothetical protein
MLGSVVDGPYGATGNFVNGVPKFYSAVTITQPGIYIVTFSALGSLQTATLNGSHAWVDDGSGNYLGYLTIPANSATGITQTLALSSSFCYTLTTTKTFTLNFIAQFTGGNVATSVSGFVFKFVRIA